MAFYPGVDSQAEAVQLSIQPGVRLPDVKFKTFRQSVYRIHIRVVTPDRTAPTSKDGCGVAVDSKERNPLSYHISHALEEDGTYTFGYIPPGKYQVTTYFEPFSGAGKWKPTQKEVVVNGDTKTVIELELAGPN